MDRPVDRIVYKPVNISVHAEDFTSIFPWGCSSAGRAPRSQRAQSSVIPSILQVFSPTANGIANLRGDAMPNQSKLTLFKRKNGFYYILYTQDGKRKWKSTGATTKSDAIQALSIFCNLTKPKLPSSLLSQFISEFIPFATATYSRCTAEFYRNSMNRLLKMVGDCRLDFLTMQHLDRFKVSRISDRKGGERCSEETNEPCLRVWIALQRRIVAGEPYEIVQQILTWMLVEALHCDSKLLPREFWLRPYVRDARHAQ